jgi:hypothetical protein
MANVAFKSGLSSALFANGMTYTDGTFYLTTDTHKFYVYRNNELIDLNHFIKFVNTQEQLSALTGVQVNDVAYVKNDNILCIKTASGWTQINPNTQLAIDDGAVTLSTVSSGVGVTMSVEDTAGRTASGSFSIVPGNGNIHLSQENGVITISSDNATTDHVYTFGTSGNSNSGLIKVTTTYDNSTSTATPISIVGEHQASVRSSNDGVITIDVPNKEIASYISFDSSGVLSVSADLVTTGSSSAVTPTISYGSATTSTAFLNGVAVLDVYTKAETTALLTGAIAANDAMSYKGTVNGDTAEATLFQNGDDNGSYAGNIGDTYKVSDTFSWNGTTYRRGDLIIAKPAHSSATDGSVLWETVPSGDDYQLVGGVSTASFELIDNLSHATFLGVTLAASTASDRAPISITGTVTSSVDNVGGEVTYTFEHGTFSGTAITTSASTATVTSATTLSSAGASVTTIDIPVVTSISKDAVGHVTDVGIAKYRIVDSHNHITGVAITPTVSASSAVVTVEVSGNDTDSQNDVMVFSTSSGSAIQFSTGSVNVNSSSRSSVQIDFVWGTF